MNLLSRLFKTGATLFINLFFTDLRRDSHAFNKGRTVQRAQGSFKTLRTRVKHSLRKSNGTEPMSSRVETTSTLFNVPTKCTIPSFIALVSSIFIKISLAS